ncbi:MAG: phage protease, partial [bacterium]
ARQAIDAREFRYISPTWIVPRVKSGVLKIIRIENVSLLNNPALTLPALAGADPEGDPSMDELKKLLEALGLDPDTDIDKAVETAEAMAAGHEHLTAAIEAAGVKTTNELPEAVKRLAEKAEAGKREDTGKETAEVSDLRQKLETANAQVDSLVKKVATLETAHATDKAAAAVDAAIEAGKLTPAQRAWALDYAKANAEGFEAFVKAQPTIVKPGREPREKPDPAAITVTDEDKASAAAMGLDLDDKEQLEQWQKAAAQIKEELEA